MAKIKAYPKATNFDAGDVFLKDGPNGTMQITVDDVLREFSSDIGDETLSMADKLAPAKKVGDELAKLGDRIDAIIRDMCEEDSRIASKNYSIGDYIIVDDVLYKVDKVISEGDDIFENDRVVAINIMREVRRLEVRINAIIRDIGEEVSSVASKSYDVNDYLVLNDVLYKVAKPISIGDDILEGDRVAAINLTTEVKRLEGRINTVVRDLSEESGVVASKDYAPGEYIIIKDILYKVIKPIVRNDNILENDRVEAISIMGEIESVYGRISKLVHNIGEEDTSTATRAYEVGDYIIVDDVLYKVVKPISIGDNILENDRAVVITITCEVKRLGGRINAIIADICDEVSPIAAEEYDIGDYLVIGDKFYRVVKDIAEGEAILEENRVIETTVADELKSLVERDYDIHIINRPKIDNHLLEANNNTHEDLELISERDFVTEFSGKTDGIEIVLPSGTPSSPIEISEIDDSAELKYSTVHTSSNYHINMTLDELRRLIEGKIQMRVVSELPEPPTPNSIYLVGPVEGLYTKYIVDSLGQVHNVGSDNVQLDDYVQKTTKIGSNTLENDVTVSELLDDIKAAKKIDLSYLKENTALTEMPETPTDTTVLTSKAVKDAIGNKQDIITDKGIYYDLTDTTWITGIYKDNGELCRKSMQLIKLWGWLVQSCCSETIPGPDNVPNLEVPTSQAIIDYVATAVKGTRATGSSAFTYNSNQTVGLTISGDYDSATPRQISKVGRRVNLSFCLKGTAVAAGANWTYIGTVPEGYRPVKRTSITAQIYNGNGNEPAGGYVDPNGWVVIWTNTKSATNNYQVRVNSCWDAE